MRHERQRERQKQRETGVIISTAAPGDGQRHHAVRPCEDLEALVEKIETLEAGFGPFGVHLGCKKASKRQSLLHSAHRLSNVIYTDVLDKENVYTALSRQNRRLLDTLTMLVRMQCGDQLQWHCTRQCYWMP